MNKKLFYEDRYERYGYEMTIHIEGNRIFCPYQSEIEDIALSIENTNKEIYFDIIKIPNSEYTLFFDRNKNKWELGKGII